MQNLSLKAIINALRKVGFPFSHFPSPLAGEGGVRKHAG
jgi:hypothetical protein